MDCTLERYRVQEVPIDSIDPSPENDDLYGAIEHDEQIDILIESIRERGLEEPIVITRDNFILSGHRRYYACKRLGWTHIPVSRRQVRRLANPEFHRELATFNTHRIKGVGSLLRESLLRQNTGEDLYRAIVEHRDAATKVDAEFLTVDGDKDIEPVGAGRQEFLKAAQAVIEDLRDYWPLSVRQVHYRLLNNPPMTLTPKGGKFTRDHYLYKNDKKSYNKLVRLLTSARYHGQVSMTAIDDPTRPVVVPNGWSTVAKYLEDEMSIFLAGYHRDKQNGQARHIEVFAEKSTLYRIVERACEPYYVPFSIGRGFCSIPVWRDMAKRFRESGREAMSLIVVSDYDPEGLALADDAIRSLKLFGVDADYHRVAVTREQIDDLDLANDCNPAKESSTQYAAFVKRTGARILGSAKPCRLIICASRSRTPSNRTWTWTSTSRYATRNAPDCDELARIKRTLASDLRF